jgi:predicted MFS family arabinose efflux permease
MNSIRSGTLLFILGLICCQFGLLVILYEPLSSFISNIMPFHPEFLGFILQIFGTASITYGIINLISGVMAEMSKEYTRQISDILQKIRETYLPQTMQKVAICKFCGAPIEGESIFCRVCGRSQK